MNFDPFLSPLADLEDCSFCPRNCHVNRVAGVPGYCRSDEGFNIASICIHRGEEPVISGPAGICNIFFTNCNLQCVYCQNHQVSDVSRNRKNSRMNLEEVVNRITGILDTGISMVGFVSPSHVIPQVKIIISVIEHLGYKPVWVYNTNGYDKPETIRSLEGLIDVYLPDFKYSDSGLASRYSGAADYPEVASRSLKEMFRQKGSTLILSGEGIAESGIVLRHLILPGQTKNSKDILRFIADEISPKLHISLMSQYYPAGDAASFKGLSRGITSGEYKEVIEEMESLGMFNGWYQELESHEHYRPDFYRLHPFEDK
jgi:putative pyruvate formate lyase activating enzyme